MRLKRLIAVDGLDGSGKNTHASSIKTLIERNGEVVVIRSHPSAGRLGRASKNALQGEGHVARFLATIFFTLDVLVSVRWYNRKADSTVIFVRYILGTAYLPRRLAPYGYRLFRNMLPFPDLALFIDIDPEIAIRRIEQRDHTREMFETKDKLDKVRHTVGRLIGDEWTVVDNSEDGERAFRQIEEILGERGFI